MRAGDRELSCRNCGQTYPANRLDRQRWCPRCRREVIRRATRVGRIAGIVGALLLMAYVLLVAQPSRFLMLWLALTAAVYFFLYKLTQRVAFEVIRARGVPSPED